MNLSELKIPSKFKDMLKTYELYYNEFYLETVRMSNSKLNNYIDSYIKMLDVLSKMNYTPNIIRAGIGLVSLHRIGYDNFQIISRMMDRIIPQKELEYVKFTSWCIQNLIHYPNDEQAQYVIHLFDRFVGWTRVHGRRRRNLAAAYLLSALATNAGTVVVGFVPVLKSVVYDLISCPEIEVIFSTSKAIFMFIRALMSYKRSQLDEFLDYFKKFSIKLLCDENENIILASLLIFNQLIRSCPDFILGIFQPLYTSIIESVSEKSNKLQIIACETLALLSLVDQKTFIDNCVEDLFEKVKTNFHLYPKYSLKVINILLENTSEFMEKKIDEIKSIVDNNDIEPKYVFKLLTKLIQSFGGKKVNIEKELLDKLFLYPFDKYYCDFFISFTLNIEITDYFRENLTNCLFKELLRDNSFYALKMIANVPKHTFNKHDKIYKKIISLSSLNIQKNKEILPMALYNLIDSSKELSIENITTYLFNFAICERDSNVRYITIKVLFDNFNQILSRSEYIDYLNKFVNDDAAKVREVSIQILEKLLPFNPLSIMTLLRKCFLNLIFSIKNVPSIRQKSRSSKILPNLIHAMNSSIQAYTDTIMNIFVDVISNHEQQDQTFENFLEKKSYILFFTDLIQSVSLLAPLDPNGVAKYSSEMIPTLCLILNTEANRNITLSIIQLFFVLFSAPASSIKYLTHSALILATCTNFLKNTKSRKARIAILQVIGSLGVMEVRLSPPEKSTQFPKNTDELLTRNFFQPSRDSDLSIDDSSYFDLTQDQYFLSIVASSLLEIFFDDKLKEHYIQVVKALVTILACPKTFALSYFDHFISRLLDVLENTSDNLMIIQCLGYYSQLILESKNNSLPFLERSVKLIIKLFYKIPELDIQLLNLIISFLKATHDGFNPYSTEIVCILVVCLDNYKTTNFHVSKLVLIALSYFSLYVSHLLDIIIPQICDSIECSNTLPDVRVFALKTLANLVLTVNVSQFSGQITRSLLTGIYSDDKKTVSSAFELFAALYHKKNEANGISIILDKLKEEKNISQEFIENVKVSEIFENFNFVIKKDIHEFKFFEEQIIQTLSFNYSNNIEHWFRSFVIQTITNSPYEGFRASADLASSYYPLALKIFNQSFLSCWLKMSEEGKKIITQAFKEELFINYENFQSIITYIMNLIEFMYKIGKPLDINKKELVKYCMNVSKSYGLALKVQGDIIQEQPNNPKEISKLIDIYICINQRSNAIGVWKKYAKNSLLLKKPEVLAKLHMWEEVESIYKNNYKKSTKSFRGLIESLSAMSNWSQIKNLYTHFEELKRVDKLSVSLNFAEAFLHLGEWDLMKEVLKYLPTDSLKSCKFSALCALHEKNYNIDGYIKNGFSLLASNPLSFSTQSNINQKLMLYCQELVEINEMKKWICGINKHEIEEVWSNRLKTTPRDFDLWLGIIANRASLTTINDDHLINFFQLKSDTLGTKTHFNALNILFPHFNFSTAPDLHKICFAVAHWTTGDKQSAIQEIESLTKSITDESLLRKCKFLYSSWIFENDYTLNGVKIAYENLQELTNFISQRKILENIENPSISARRKSSFLLPSLIYNELTSDTKYLEILRKWTDVNIALIHLDPNNLVKYVINAIASLTLCTKLDQSFPDIVLLLNLFFENASQPGVFNSKTVRDSISNLKPSLLLQASPQLLVQLSHQSKEVASFVHDIVYNLLNNHYHELIFSLFVLKRSKNIERSVASKKLLEEFKAIKPEIYKEIKLIRTSLLRASITWSEKALQLLDDAFYYYNLSEFEEMRKMLKCLVNAFQIYIDKKADVKCEMQQSFLDKYSNYINQIERYIKCPRINSYIDKIRNACNAFYSSVFSEVNSHKTIELSSISEQLNEKTNFAIAVPGTYDPSSKLITIEYFVRKFSVFHSKQTPKDVIVKGSDGNFYQYLLKGHEDLRLDERIMQFFRLVNSYIMNETCFNGLLIRTTCVIPLDKLNGLVQWIPGTETLNNVVEYIRNLRHEDTQIEYKIAEKITYQGFSNLEPFQRMEVIGDIFNQVPDTDISNFFLLKSPDLKTWLRQIQTFSISAAMTSTIGYVIGLGDRHPSNLLIDSVSGKVVHIDFGDCFEKAEKRKEFPEVVPFRLTRHMVNALGPPGVNGEFRSSFISMANVLRENYQTLIMVLAIFVQEPLFDPDEENEQMNLNLVSRTQNLMLSIEQFDINNNDESVSANVEITKRVREKLTGTDFNTPKPLTTEEQFEILIEKATDLYNLSKMYTGWCPFW